MSMEDNMPAIGERSTKPDPARSEFACGSAESAKRWPSDRVQKLLGIDLPIIQAPMAGATTSAMAIAVAQAGALGSLPGATLSLEAVRAELDAIRSRTSKPINLSFFCHA